MGLLRNVNESWIDIAGDGPLGVFNPKRTFRANDPEAHIRRLESFGAGIGVNLTSNRGFSNKTMITSPRGDASGIPKNVLLGFDEHDEAFPYTRGHLAESVNTLIKDVQELRYPEPLAWKVDDNLAGTRSPFHHNAEIIPDIQYRRYPNEISGETAKNLADPEGGVSTFRQNWGAYEDEQLKESNFKERTAGFRGDIRQRIVSPGRDVSEVIENMLRNPTRDSFKRVNNPEMFSSQFVKIITPHGQDVVDLGTGNWAKIDPDEYFPH